MSNNIVWEERRILSLVENSQMIMHISSGLYAKFIEQFLFMLKVPAVFKRANLASGVTYYRCRIF